MADNEKIYLKPDKPKEPDDYMSLLSGVMNKEYKPEPEKEPSKLSQILKMAALFGLPAIGEATRKHPSKSEIPHGGYVQPAKQDYLTESLSAIIKARKAKREAEEKSMALFEDQRKQKFAEANQVIQRIQDEKGIKLREEDLKRKTEYDSAKIDLALSRANLTDEQRKIIKNELNYMDVHGMKMPTAKVPTPESPEDEMKSLSKISVKGLKLDTSTRLGDELMSAFTNARTTGDRTMLDNVIKKIQGSRTDMIRETRTVTNDFGEAETITGANDYSILADAANKMNLFLETKGVTKKPTANKPIAIDPILFNQLVKARYNVIERDRILEDIIRKYSNNGVDMAEGERAANEYVRRAMEK